MNVQTMKLMKNGSVKLKLPTAQKAYQITKQRFLSFLFSSLLLLSDGISRNHRTSYITSPISTLKMLFQKLNVVGQPL